MLHLRVFLSSPGDVQQERRAARDIVASLQKRPLLRGRVTIDIVSYDDPDAPSPMTANETPQDSVNRYTGRPSDCDLVVVILWSRLGTPIPPEVRRADGTRFESGTVWEYEDALGANKDVWVYRRTEVPSVALTDPDFERKRADYATVNWFFQRFTNPDRSLKGGCSLYACAADFAPLFEKHLESFLRQRLEGAVAMATSLDGDLAARLRAHLIDASDHIADKTTGFVGRRFVFDALDQFLRDHDRGYFVVRGDPGLGKTAIAAQLVRERGYAHHFNIAAEGITSTRRFVQNVAAQLILRHQLVNLMASIDSAEDAVLLKSALAAAAGVSAQPVVIVVDALDEADPPKNPRANPLCLPSSLPHRCYVIATTRRTEADLDLGVEDVQLLELEADSAGNLADVGAYIDNALLRPAMAEKARDWPGGAPALAADLRQQSEGNFMYLRHVLPAIERGEFRPGHQPLPRGLAGYYRQHWEKMRGDDLERFVRVNQKVIAVLAVARQPVTIDLVARVTRLTTTEVNWTFARWQEFLHATAGPTGDRYRLYHASYRDFLAQQVG